MSHKIYRHVIVVGVDGAGRFFREADTPSFDRIFRDGSVTYRAYASNPSISAECWGSMLTGVSPKVHGLTNSVVAAEPYPENSPFPTLFKRIHTACPDYVLGCYAEWSPVFFGMCEHSLPVWRETAPDTYLTPAICSFIELKKPNFLFIQLDSVDGAGHKNGYGSAAYLARLHEVDAMIGRIYEATERAGILDDTLFIVIADHGGTYDGEGQPGHHGGWTENERLVTFALRGTDIRPGEMGDANVRDLAAIVLYALGIPAPDFAEEGWTSQIPEDLFLEEGIPPYRDISAESQAIPRVSCIPHTEESV